MDDFPQSQPVLDGNELPLDATTITSTPEGPSFTTLSQDMLSVGMDPDVLATQFKLSTHFTGRLVQELGKRQVSTDLTAVAANTRSLLQTCSGLFNGTSTKSLGVYYLGDEDSSQEQFLDSARAHFETMRRIFGGDSERFFKREIYYRQRIDNTPYYLIIRRGFLENNWGIEFAIGTEDANWQRTEKIEDNKDLARIGVNFDTDGVRIVNIEGVENAKKLINKQMPKTLKHKPLNLLILLVAMWAHEEGFAKIRGIRDSHQKYLGERLEHTPDLFSYEKVFEAVGMTPQNDAWMGVDTGNFYDQLLAQLSPAQYDGFDDIANAFGNLVPLDRTGRTTYSDYPFYLREDPQILESLINVIRYSIRKHIPGFGPTKLHKKFTRHNS